MPRRLLAALTLIWIPLGAPAARAQDPVRTTPSTFAVEASVGRAAFVDDTEDLDHALVGGAARFRLTPRLSVGPEIVYMSAPGNDHDLFVMGSVWLDLIATDPVEPDRFVPFLVVGAGLMRHTDGSDYWTYSSTEGALSAGGGLRVAFGRRWYGLLELRGGWEPHVRITAGLGYRFGGRP
jgi:hypothetical protein